MIPLLRHCVPACCLAAACGAAAAASEKLPVVVSILPQLEFVERIGGAHVEAQALVGPGQSPHAYEPTPRQLEYVARARAYFTIGIDFEQALVPRIRKMFPKLRVVDTRAGVPLRHMTPAELAAEHHDHGDGHDHAEHGHTAEGPGPASQPAGPPDPHIWLNPLYVKIQTQTICTVLAELDPPRAEEYRANLARYHAELDRVHAKLSAALAPLRGRELFVFHPAFGYLADAYGLRQVPVEIEGREPTPRQLAALIARAKAAGVKVILVQPQLPRKSAETVARAIGGVVEPMDDLPREYLKSLEEMADKIRAALTPAPQ